MAAPSLLPNPAGRTRHLWRSQGSNLALRYCGPQCDSCARLAGDFLYRPDRQLSRGAVSIPQAAPSKAALTYRRRALSFGRLVRWL